MWEIGQREDGNSTALCHGNWGCTTLKLMLAEFWRHRAHFKKKNVGCSPAPLANYRPAASSTTTPKKVPSLAFLCICDVLCTVSSYPPWFFLHVAAIMIIFCTYFFSSLKMEAEKLAQEKTEIQRQYIMVRCSVLPFFIACCLLVYLKALFTLWSWSCLAFSIEKLSLYIYCCDAGM